MVGFVRPCFVNRNIKSRGFSLSDQIQFLLDLESHWPENTKVRVRIAIALLVAVIKIASRGFAS